MDSQIIWPQPMPVCFKSLSLPKYHLFSKMEQQMKPLDLSNQVSTSLNEDVRPESSQHLIGKKQLFNNQREYTI